MKNNDFFSSIISGLMLAVLLMSAAAALPVSAQDLPPAPDPNVPQAITHTVWIGYQNCTATTATNPNDLNCWADNGVSTSGSAQTINVGDSVKFDSLTQNAHDVTSGILTFTATGACGTAQSKGNFADPNAMRWISTPVSAFTGANAYIYRFDKPGTYWYYCTPHRNIQWYKIVVNPANTPCVGSACQSPLLEVRKMAVGQNINTVCGYGAQTQGTTQPPVAVAANTVLCWTGQSLTPLLPGAARVYRDTLPAFNSASDPNFVELTNATRQTCSPNFTDTAALPVGQSIFYYRVCDNAACTNS